MREHRLIIEDALRAARAEGRPADHAAMLREAGAPVSRDSRDRWFTDGLHPAAVRWLAELAGTGDVTSVREALRYLAADRAKAARIAAAASKPEPAPVPAGRMIRGNAHPDMEYFDDS